MRRVASTSSSTSSTLAHGYLDKGNDDYAETLIDAPTTSLPTSREDAEASTFMTSTRLRLISVVLHSLLVAIFLALLIISLKEAEHRVVFSLDHQKTVSFAITAITTGFGTIYLGLLVYVTQTISIRRILQTDQTLTAIHDTTAAWAGIGSAVFHLWHQTRVRSSVIGVLSVFGYLGGVLILHVATPSLFAVQTFNSSTLVPVGTYGLPSWNVNWPNGTNVADYAAGSLYSIPTVVESNTSLGLSGGTLYDVLDDHAGVGNVSVSATGFNISCTYPTNMTVSDDLLTASGLKRRQNVVGVQLTAPWFELQGKGIPKPFYMKRSAQYGVISAMTDSPDGPGTISRAEPGPLLLFSTIPIIDSENTRPPMTVLNTSYSQGGDLDAVQVVHCVQRLVPQTAVVDVQSHRLIAVEPNIQKTTSTWVPQDTVVENISTGNTFLDGWAQWYLAMPPSTFPLYPPIPDLPYLSVGASYLIEKLQMHPSTSANASAHPGNVTLHDLENALSTLVASVFWTLGHVPPVANTATRDVLPSPQLIRGSATVTQVLTLGRLDSNIIAILIGLCASVFVTTLAFPSLLGRHGAKNNDLPIDSTGILHTMWLYRNHPALRTTLQQIELPTTNGLRKAGMIRTKVYNGDSHLLHASFIETHDAFFNEKAPYTDVPPDLPPTSLPHYREGGRFQLSKALRVSSLILHSVLVVTHLALVVIWSTGAEHRVIFSLDRQRIVSFATTAITTAFGTMYLGLVVFVTQTLSTKRLIQTEQTLTAIHDITASWSGIGAAVSHLWHQTRVHASFTGVLSVFLSLLSVLGLHVSTPALFVVQTFNSSRLVGVETRSLPSWNMEWSNETTVTDYTLSSLYSLPTVIGSNASLGLHGGTLYDVLEDNSGA